MEQVVRPLASNPELRNTLCEIQTRNQLVIDNISLDTVAGCRIQPGGQREGVAVGAILPSIYRRQQRRDHLPHVYIRCKALLVSLQLCETVIQCVY